jgi:acetyl esterase/lipase
LYSALTNAGSFIDWARQNSAILLNCDYRLLPEATGNDILEDVADFWAWLSRDFPTAMTNTKTGVQPALDDIAVIGESAGEPSTPYLAISCIDLFLKADTSLFNLGFFTRR